MARESADIGNNSEKPTSESASGVTIGDLLQTIRKHWVSAIVTVIVVMVAVTAFTVLSPKKYTATSELYATYNTDSATSSNVTDINTAGTYISSQIKSYPKLAVTEAVLQPVIDNLDLQTTIDDLADFITVTNPTDTMLVDISVETESPQQSRDIADAVARSLSNTVSSSLYSAKNSPVKLAVVQKAVEPAEPSSPKITLNLLIGAVLAVVLAIFVAILRDMLDTRLRTVHDLQEITRAPLLGSIPTDSGFVTSIPMISQPGSHIAEEYRRVRTNLTFLAPVPGTKSQLFVISSAVPNEGKTTTSINLAAALAENGARVLLIDADLRRPSVATKLGMDNNVGLAHVLSGQVAVADVIQRFWKPNLHVMPAGPKPPNASMLLNSKIMEALLIQALRQYDYVLVDTTPMSVAGDAVTFSKFGNGVVLVAGRGVCDKRDLRDVTEQFTTAKIPMVGTVLNFAEILKKRHGYYYYYDTEGKRKPVHGKKDNAGQRH